MGEKKVFSQNFGKIRGKSTIAIRTEDMAPLKLPAKKPKGKGKQLHTDYTTLESARATAPSDWSAEEWLEGALQARPIRSVRPRLLS